MPSASLQAGAGIMPAGNSIISCRLLARLSLKRAELVNIPPEQKLWLTNIWMLSGMTCGPYLYALVHAGLLNRLLRAEKLQKSPGNKGQLVSPQDPALLEI